MSRDIKFRAIPIDKPKNSKEFVYGDCAKVEDRAYILQGKLDDDGVIWSYTEVHPDSIGEYTGLKDKKKDLTDIYEGDILGENGLVKGNIHETPELLEERTNIVIANMGTDEWRDSEQEAIRRGCNYAQ